MAQDTTILDGSPISSSTAGNTSTDIVEPIGGNAGETGAAQSNLANEYTNWTASQSQRGDYESSSKLGLGKNYTTGSNIDAREGVLDSRRAERRASSDGYSGNYGAETSTADTTTTTTDNSGYASEVQTNGRSAGQLAQTVLSAVDWDSAITAADTDFLAFQQAQQSVTGSATSEAIAKLAGDNAEVINQMYDAQEESLEAQYWQQYEQSKQAYMKTYNETADQYNEAMNTQVRQDAIGYRNMLGQLAYNGVNTGTASQAMLAMQSNADNNFLELNKAKSKALSDLATEFASYEANLKIEITKAIADNDFQRATALYQESQNADALALQSAQIKAEYGDFSGYEDMGWDKDTVNQMKITWAGSNSELALSTGMLDEMYNDGIITLSEYIAMANPWTVEGSTAWYQMQTYTASTKGASTPTIKMPATYTNPNSGGGAVIINPDGSSSNDYRKPDPNEDGTYSTDVGAVVDFCNDGTKKTYTDAEFAHLVDLIKQDFTNIASKYGYDIMDAPNRLFEDLLTDGVKAQQVYQEIQSMCTALIENGYLGQNALTAIMQNELGGEQSLQYLYMAGMNCTVESISNSEGVLEAVDTYRGGLSLNYTKEMQKYMGGKKFNDLTNDQITWLAINVAGDPERFGLKEGDISLEPFTSVAKTYKTEENKVSPFIATKNYAIDPKTGERIIVYTQAYNTDAKNDNGTPMWAFDENNNLVLNPQYFKELTPEQQRAFSVAYAGNADGTVLDFSNSIAQSNSYLARACQYYQNSHSEHSFMTYSQYKRLADTKIGMSDRKLTKAEEALILAGKGTASYTTEAKSALIKKAMQSGSQNDWAKAAAVCGYSDVKQFKADLEYIDKTVKTGTNTGANISATTAALGELGGQDTTGKSDADIISDAQYADSKNTAETKKEAAKKKFNDIMTLINEAVIQSNPLLR